MVMRAHSSGVLSAMSVHSRHTHISVDSSTASSPPPELIPPSTAPTTLLPGDLEEARRDVERGRAGILDTEDSSEYSSDDEND